MTDEAGHLIESADIRNQNDAEKNEKTDLLKKDMPAPELYPDKKTDILSLDGAARTAQSVKRDTG
jgi:hypothetical protein